MIRYIENPDLMKLHHLLLSSVVLACSAVPTVAWEAPKSTPTVIAQKAERTASPADIEQSIKTEAEILNSGKIDRAALSKLYQSVVDGTFTAGNFTEVPSKQTQVFFQSLAQKYPNSGIVSILLARSLVDVGQISRANTVYVSAIKASPKHPLLYDSYAALQQEQGKSTAAIATLESGIAVAPKNIEAYVTIAKLQPNNLTGLIKQLDRALAAVPDEPIVYEYFGNLITSNAEYANADLSGVVTRFQKGRDRFPKFAPIYINLGVFLSTKNRDNQFLSKTIEQGITNGADSGLLNRYMGDDMLITNSKSTDRAIEYYRKSIDGGGQFCLDGGRERTSTLMQRGKTKEMMSLMARTLERQQDLSQFDCIALLWQLNTTQPKLRQQTIALLQPTIDRLLKQPTIADEYVSAPNLMLKLLMEEKQYTQVISEGNRLAQKADNWTDLHITIGRAQHELKQWTEAEKSFKTAETIFQKLSASNPQLKSAFGRSDLLSASRWHLGSLLQAQGKMDLAMAEFELTIQAVPFTDEDVSSTYKARAYNSMGEILLTQGNSKGAIAKFEAAIKESDTYQVAKTNLGKAKSQTNKGYRYKKN
jgi:tetratricopeptide (TPR) repeat protein